jgi:hypothetical protein
MSREFPKSLSLHFLHIDVKAARVGLKTEPEKTM